MKSFVKLIILITIIEGFASNVNCQDRWWQREIPTPSANQIINPDYLSTKRELEQSLDRQNYLETRRKQYTFGTKNEADYAFMVAQMKVKIMRLEEELQKIPVYISNPNLNNSNTNIQNNNQQNNEINVTSNSISSSPSTANSYLLTLYKIKNCNKGDFKSDYEYNAESLNLFNELKINIIKIINAETNNHNSNIDFIKEKIKYYELFINNWGEGKTIGTQEAIKEIDNLTKEILNAERTVFSGGKILDQTWFGSTVQQEFIHPLYKNYTLNITIPTLPSTNGSADFGNHPNVKWSNVNSFIQNGDFIVANIIFESNGIKKEIVFKSKDFTDFNSIKETGNRWLITGSKDMELLFLNFKIELRTRYTYCLNGNSNTSWQWKLGKDKFRVFVDKILLTDR